jgi:HSP20 family protein
MTLVKFNEHKGANGYSTFNDLFDNFFNEGVMLNKKTEKHPAVNIYENETSFIVELAAPGLKKEDFKINLEKDVLSISAQEKQEAETEQRKVYRKEFSYQSFKRVFNLPDLIDRSNIDAKYQDGILIVSIAKKEDKIVKTRIIAVK